jgi:hypoxanthine-DNA glycosylase
MPFRPRRTAFLLVNNFFCYLMLPTEIHPFGAFVPETIRCLIVGSFPGKEQTRGVVDDRQWFYGAPRNQFWKIMELVYKKELRTRQQKQSLFKDAGIGITDLVKSCIRTKGTNLDENLDIKEYNTEIIAAILQKNQPAVLFTSRFVERVFKKLFPTYSNTDILPSPSPRYYRLSIEDKARIYKNKLPQLSLTK